MASNRHMISKTADQVRRRLATLETDDTIMDAVTTIQWAEHDLYELRHLLLAQERQAIRKSYGDKTGDRTS